MSDIVVTSAKNVSINPELYPEIFKRKSIRKYTGTPFSEEQLAAVKATISSLQPLFPSEKYHFELSTGKESLRINAYCEETAISRANVGFLLQQADLTMHKQGFGRLWFGMGNEPKGISAPAGLTYFICMKIGMPAEPLSREAASEFDRKPIGEVIAAADMQPIFEAVRLAPSAANSQPWLFQKDGAAIHAFRVKHGAIKNAMFGKMNQGDMGIALCHAVLALEHNNIRMKEITVIPGVVPPKGFDYTATICIEQ